MAAEVRTSPASAGSGRVLGIIADMYAARVPEGVYIHLSFGRVIDRLAARYERTLLCVPVQEGVRDSSRDYRLQAPNIELVPQPYYTSVLGGLRYPGPLARAYAEVCRRADRLFVRGHVPYGPLLYGLAWRRRQRPTQWVVGNGVALLRSHRRASLLKDTCGLLYAYQDQFLTRVGRRLTDGTLICNGAELGEIFRSPRTVVTVSSTITDDEFCERPDTCQGPVVQILFVGFPRPEKGIQYLIEALALLKTTRRCELTVVGAAERYAAYRQELERLAGRLGVADRIRWLGYVPFGPGLFEKLREADLLVLPTLSEGTPRVLIEARANSVPIIATRVGGIPTSVQDGVDGLLVPPKDSAAIARAIERIVDNPTFRQNLIREGLAAARRMTVDHFAALAYEQLEEGVHARA